MSVHPHHRPQAAVSKAESGARPLRKEGHAPGAAYASMLACQVDRAVGEPERDLVERKVCEGSLLRVDDGVVAIAARERPRVQRCEGVSEAPGQRIAPRSRASSSQPRAMVLIAATSDCPSPSAAPPNISSYAEKPTFAAPQTSRAGVAAGRARCYWTFAWRPAGQGPETLVR